MSREAFFFGAFWATIRERGKNGVVVEHQLSCYRKGSFLSDSCPSAVHDLLSPNDPKLPTRMPLLPYYYFDTRCLS